MLSLNSERWNDLTHAYGRASDIPNLLKKLAHNLDTESRKRVWTELRSSLCGASGVYTASYAALPHIVTLAAMQPARERLEYIAFTGMVEAFRHRKEAQLIPPDLESDYQSALKQASSLILECLKSGWDERGYKILLGALATVRGEPRLGSAIMGIS